ncbi:MAG: hypothetical protein GXO89_14550, partial [Chlorobi bacterium]|nr:hypothetical protein [Chlorobiota bacterium]
MRKLRIFIIVFASMLLGIQLKAQEKDSGCTSCYNTLLPQQGDYSSRLGLENLAVGNYSLAGGWLSQTTSTGRASLAFGYKAIAAEDVSFAFGMEAQANGDKSFAFGADVISSGAGTKTFGSHLLGLAPFAITFGAGFSEEKPFINAKEYSFAIATKSDRATFFVSRSPSHIGGGTTGQVGIGTTEPKSKLHIKADEGEEAAILIEPFEWTTKTNAVIKLGNDEHQILVDGTFGMILKTPVGKNFGFLNGNVGIGTNSPIAKLDIDGTVRVAPFATEPGQHKIIFADEDGFLFTDNLPLYDNLGNHTAEQDIITNGNWIKHSESEESEGIFISDANKVGIGTSMPIAMLDVRSAGETGIIAMSSQAQNSGFWAANSVFAYGFGVDSEGVGHISANMDSPVNIINFFSNGKIAIGNARPLVGTSHRLFVEGGITSEEVVINSLNENREWPDYVLKEGYELLPLTDLKDFIDTNGHLPNVITADEVSNKGQNLGEINTMLLEKI